MIIPSIVRIVGALANVLKLLYVVFTVGQGWVE